MAAASSAEGAPGRTLAPLYSFTGDEAQRGRALEQFERIDDVVMGGVSKSQLADGGGFASWRGLVRTEGGGFCGQRTRRFEQPMNLSGAEGLYISCRLASDTDVDRRIWKLSLRTDEGRGEVVYQAQFTPPVQEMSPVYVPFSDFALVRGPVMIEGAPQISNTSAIYQVGFTCSKFALGKQMTPLEGFRNGTFQLDIGELGAYSIEGASGWSEAVTDGVPSALDEAEVRRKRPLLLKLFLPVLGLVFSEAKRRRRRARQLLRERGASRLELLRFGWSLKRGLGGRGVASSALATAGEVVGGALGLVLSFLVRLLVLPVVRLLGRRERRRTERRLGARKQ